MSHRKLNQHNQLYKLNRWNFIKTGLLIAGLALCFILNRTYFFYPPQLAPTWNNLWFDSIGLISGLALILCGVFNLRIEWLIKISLGVSVAFLTVLLVAESFHIVGANFFWFIPFIIFDIYSIANLMQLAYEYEPRD